MPFFRQTIESTAVSTLRRRDHGAAHTAVTVAARATCRCRSSAFRVRRASGRAPQDGVGGGRASRSATRPGRLWSTRRPRRKMPDVSWLNNGRVVAADRRAPVAMTSRCCCSRSCQVLSAAGVFARSRMSGVRAMRVPGGRAAVDAGRVRGRGHVGDRDRRGRRVAPPPRGGARRSATRSRGAALGSPNLATLTEVRESPFAAPHHRRRGDRRGRTRAAAVRSSPAA
jgi:hypothetical protein